MVDDAFAIKPWVKAITVEVETMVLSAVEVNGHAKSALLLNVVQSAAVKSPRTVAEELGSWKVNVPPTFVIPQSFEMASEEVASVSAPVCAAPKVWAKERTPVLVTLPL